MNESEYKWFRTNFGMRLENCIESMIGNFCDYSDMDELTDALLVFRRKNYEKKIKNLGRKTEKLMYIFMGRSLEIVTQECECKCGHKHIHEVNKYNMQDHKWKV